MDIRNYSWLSPIARQIYPALDCGSLEHPEKAECSGKIKQMCADAIKHPSGISSSQMVCRLSSTSVTYLARFQIHTVGKQVAKRRHAYVDHMGIILDSQLLQGPPKSVQLRPSRPGTSNPLPSCCAPTQLDIWPMNSFVTLPKIHGALDPCTLPRAKRTV